jgi:PPE-repeat protein
MRLMSFMVLPPEINSLLMFSGAGSALLEAASAWDGLASELGTAASSFGSVTSGLAGQAWQGPASEAMAAAAAPYTGWLNSAAPQAAGAAGQARAIVSAFEAAQAATVRPVLVSLNRNSLVQMVMSNWFGLHAPAIAQIEADYEAMWAQDVSAMSGYYSGASAAAAGLTPA